METQSHAIPVPVFPPPAVDESTPNSAELWQVSVPVLASPRTEEDLAPPAVDIGVRAMLLAILITALLMGLTVIVAGLWA